MEEQQVTIEGTTRVLPTPFFVIATQNPHDQLGTYALPESQLDRFLMRIHIGYPPAHIETRLIIGLKIRNYLRNQILKNLSLLILKVRIPLIRATKKYIKNIKMSSALSI